jgi:DNA mismatch repair protein MLH3
MFLGPAKPEATPEWLSRALKVSMPNHGAPMEAHFCQANQAFTQKATADNTFSEPSILTSMRTNSSQRSTKFPQESGGAHHISRYQLREAKVINQIDQKFIACIADINIGAPPEPWSEGGGSRSSRILLFVDQHAADERIRVERFLQPLCLHFLHASTSRQNEVSNAVIATELKPPKVIVLTRHEASLLQRDTYVKKLFHNWGISFSEPPSESSAEAFEDGVFNDYAQVQVTSLPALLSDKVRFGHHLGLRHN